MPPVNTPALNTPMAADEADEANASFLRDSLDSLDHAPLSMSNHSLRRSHVDPQRDARRADSASYPTRSSDHTTPPLAALQRRHETVEEVTRRERLQRVLSRLNRLHDPTAASTTSAYTNRTPSPNRQSLYDWAPGHEDQERQDMNELDAILSELRRQQPDTHPDVLRVLSQSQLDSHRQPLREGNGTPAPPDMTDASERRDRVRERRRRENEWVSLRTRAAMQRSRHGSPNATDRMLRYVMERERSGVSEEEERARGANWFRSSASRAANDENTTVPSSRESWQLPPPAGDLRERDRRERVDAFRRGYLAENMPPRLPRISTPPVANTTSQPASQAGFLESALRYLSQLRECSRYEDALSTAMDHGLATKEFFADKHDDFIMDLTELSPVQESSWLQPGAAFEGHQHAATCIASLSLNAPSVPTDRLIVQINANYRPTNGSSNGVDPHTSTDRRQSFDAARPWLSHQPPLAPLKGHDPSQDHWPVRVVFHAIDTMKMTVQGTMEAYDVPQHPVSLNNLSGDRPKAGKKSAPITTYVEGHIVDLATHSFLTPSTSPSKKSEPAALTPLTSIADVVTFPAASAQTDAANWRKLPPFNGLSSSDEVARLLLSKARLAEINEQYIFMRWKERCFVHSRDDHCSEADRHGDQDRGHGLTISGFYYVSLRREDGAVEGLYFDPSSTPYQHLRLRGKGVGWPAFELR